MTLRTSLLALGLLGALGLDGAQAGEITILLNQATESGIRELAAGFERVTGHKVNISFQTGAALIQKIDAGEGDLVSLGSAQFSPLVQIGKIVDGSVFTYARVGNGVAVKTGAPKPDISTREGFRRAMLSAKSIGHTNAGTGVFNTPLFQRLGIYNEIRDRIRIVEGRVAEFVAKGEVEIGIQQTNVIQPWPGTDYVGPLPPELMEYAGFGLGRLTSSKEPLVARAFIAFIENPTSDVLLRRGAMEPRARATLH